MMFIIVGVGEVKADTDWPEEWQAHVRKLRAEGKDVKVMRSKNMTPEKSPEEFLMRYKKIREQAGDKFTFQTFVEEVARGLVIEQRYTEASGVYYVAKENLNPNYYWGANNIQERVLQCLFFKYDTFCITPNTLRNVFGKEDGIVRYQTKKTESYRYISLGTNFEVDSISGINKRCASETTFDSTFFQRMENQ